MPIIKHASIVIAAALACCSAADAAKLHWTSAADIMTFDIHAQNVSTNTLACATVYEGLVRRDDNMQPEPALATSWKRVPEGFLFKLREGVKFHEGQPLTADDVVFSIKRALHPKSNYKNYTTGITGAEKKSDTEVLVTTSTGSPVILSQLCELRIMNRAWAEEHNALEPQDYVHKQESYAAHHANGTGPFKLTTREVDVKTVFVANENWWDQKNRRGNVTEVFFQPISSGATRTAALIAGQVDFVLDPSAQDIPRLKNTSGVKVVEGAENRTLFVSMDLMRDDSPYIWGPNGEKLTKNPFKDLRVRQALNYAINREGLIRGVMRGSGVATGTLCASNINGWTKEVAKVPKYNIEKAKKLLAEAGYPNGFRVTISTPNNRWVNDENITKAIAAMWAKVGVKAEVNAMPRSQYFPKILKHDISAALVGWGSSTFDSLYVIQSLCATFSKENGNGYGNVGRASDPEIDKLVLAISKEEDIAKRNEMIHKAYRIERENLYHLPLMETMIPWAMRSNVSAPHRANNRPRFDWVVIK